MTDNTFTAEEVREWGAVAQAQAKMYAPMKGAHEPWERLAAMLIAYADLLEQRAARVTDDVARSVLESYLDATDGNTNPDDNIAAMRAAIVEAVWPVAAEPGNPPRYSYGADGSVMLLNPEESPYSRGTLSAQPVEPVAQTDNSHRFASDEHGLTGLIQACKVASSPSQGATVSHMRWLLSQCAEHLVAQPRAVPDGWISVKDHLPKCNSKPNSFGACVLIYPHYKSDGASDMPIAFYGRRQTAEPNFYIYGRILNHVTHWMPIPAAPHPGEPT